MNPRTSHYISTLLPPMEPRPEQISAATESSNFQTSTAPRRATSPTQTYSYIVSRTFPLDPSPPPQEPEPLIRPTTSSSIATFHSMDSSDASSTIEPLTYTPAPLPINPLSLNPPNKPPITAGPDSTAAVEPNPLSLNPPTRPLSQSFPAKPSITTAPSSTAVVTEPNPLSLNPPSRPLSQNPPTKSSAPMAPTTTTSEPNPPLPPRPLISSVAAPLAPQFVPPRPLTSGSSSGTSSGTSSTATAPRPSRFIEGEPLTLPDILQRTPSSNFPLLSTLQENDAQSQRLRASSLSSHPPSASHSRHHSTPSSHLDHSKFTHTLGQTLRTSFYSSDSSGASSRNSSTTETSPVSAYTLPSPDMADNEANQGRDTRDAASTSARTFGSRGVHVFGAVSSSDNIGDSSSNQTKTRSRASSGLGLSLPSLNVHLSSLISKDSLAKDSASNSSTSEMKAGESSGKEGKGLRGRARSTSNSMVRQSLDAVKSTISGIEERWENRMENHQGIGRGRLRALTGGSVAGGRGKVEVYPGT